MTAFVQEQSRRERQSTRLLLVQPRRLRGGCADAGVAWKAIAMAALLVSTGCGRDAGAGCCAADARI